MGLITTTNFLEVIEDNITKPSSGPVDWIGRLAHRIKDIVDQGSRVYTSKEVINAITEIIFHCAVLFFMPLVSAFTSVGAVLIFLKILDVVNAASEVIFLHFIIMCLSGAICIFTLAIYKATIIHLIRGSVGVYVLSCFYIKQRYGYSMWGTSGAA